jgi:NTP pyrophosphatase (non-canonical NTP hydrolase)
MTSNWTKDYIPKPDTLKKKAGEKMGNVNLTHFMIAINDLAKAKGYNQTDGWLFWKLLTELGEYSKAIEEGKDKKEISEEWADVMHLLMQIEFKHGDRDPDLALQKKIDKNWNTKKKTLDEKTQEIVKK